MSFSTKESLIERRINPSPAWLQQLESQWEESQKAEADGDRRSP